MYAPLALKFVLYTAPFSMADSLFLSAPVQKITISPLPSYDNVGGSRTGHTAAITGIAIGGAALLAIGVIVLATRRLRRRRRRPKSIGSTFETVIMEPDWPMIVTPFNPTLTEATEPEAGSQANLQQRWFEPVEPETVPLVHASTPPVPSPRVEPVPVGLSSKELARLRQDNLLSQSTDAQPSDPLLSATSELGVATSSSEARRLQSEVETLRREMEQLLAERYEVPPSYASEDGGE